MRKCKKVNALSPVIKICNNNLRGDATYTTYIIYTSKNGKNFGHPVIYKYILPINVQVFKPRFQYLYMLSKSYARLFDNYECKNNAAKTFNIFKSSVLAEK